MTDSEDLTAEGEQTSPTPEAPAKLSRKERRRAKEEARRPQTFLGWVGSIASEIAIVAVLALVISAVLRAFLLQAFVIPSESMQNTIQVGDRVVVSKVGSPSRGDIVVFADPGGWLPAGPERSQSRKVMEFVGILPDTSNQYLIKRLIGLPGDNVKCCTQAGNLTVNGVEVNETGYVHTAAGSGPAAAVPFEVVVPAGAIFVMGDHRDDSRDSRCHLADITTDGRPRGATAFVPEDLVVGKAVAVMAPLDRARTFSKPSVWQGVSAPASPAPAEATIIPEGVGC